MLLNYDNGFLDALLEVVERHRTVADIAAVIATFADDPADSPYQHGYLAGLHRALRTAGDVQ